MRQPPIRIPIIDRYGNIVQAGIPKEDLDAYLSDTRQQAVPRGTRLAPPADPALDELDDEEVDDLIAHEVYQPQGKYAHQ